MTPKPSLKRNAVANFLGAALPMIVSLVTVPLYLEHIGAARYGVLAIVWMLQGYFGYFDLGLSAATSNRIAQLTNASPAERESVMWTALVLNAGFGILGGLILYLVGHLLFAQFHIAPEINAEVNAAMPWIACAVPLATVTAVFTGALAGREQFSALNAAQFAGMLIFQIAPLVAAIVLKPELQYVIPAAIIGSAASLLLLIVVVCRVFPLSFRAGPDRQCIKPLFSYGAWVAVSNLIFPLLDSLDRLVIGRVLGAQAITWYQVSLALAVRARIVPGVFSRTLFPRLSAIDTSDAVALSISATRGLTILMTPPIVFGIFLMHPFLIVWLGPVFAANSTSVGEALLIGVWINAIAHIPGTHLGAIRRPDLVAVFHAAQLVPYIVALWWSLQHFGLVGAAIVFSLRYVVETAMLFWAAHLGAGVTRFLIMPGLLVVAAFIATVLFPWPSTPGILSWIVLVGVSLVWALHADPSWRVRVLRALSSRLPYRWRRV
jgi:O-antigen/teichoic acid export membrane protein